MKTLIKIRWQEPGIFWFILQQRENFCSKRATAYLLQTGSIPLRSHRHVGSVGLLGLASAQGIFSVARVLSLVPA
jgi:hypothetical protein